MRTFIDEKAPKTKEYVRYIFETLIKQAPLTKGANVEIDVIENKTPFPKLVEIPEGAPDMKLMSKELSNWKVRHPGRFALLYEYTNGLLDSMCIPLLGPLEPEIRINMTFNYVITDLEKIYAECKRYDVQIPYKDNVLKNTNPAVAKFYNDPPRIMWNGAIVPMKYNSRQHDICKFAFQEPINEVISWDDIAEKIDPAILRDIKKGRRSIRYAVYQINLKAKDKCGKPLFALQDKSFYRVA